MNVSLVSSLTIKSKCLFLYLSSLSLKASYTSPSFSLTIGNGLILFDNTVNFSADIDISPTLVLKTKPFIPMKSPISIKLNTS